MMYKSFLPFLVIYLHLALFASEVSAKARVTLLHQSDFDTGTVIIDEPGTYMLAEDISFNPNAPGYLGVDAYSSSNPSWSQFKPAGKYDPRAFGLGFFAAIVIAADNVVLDLNQKTLEQSKEHALLQRFYANIETASQPFVPSQGPADFGSAFKAAENLIIKNGTIGRSSHHGIHGNGSKNIRIENLIFIDYEVAAIALNGVQGLKLKDINVEHNRHDVPVLGTFSSAQFIKAYVDFLAMVAPTFSLKVQGQDLNVVNIQDALRQAINSVHDDIIVRNLGYIDNQIHPDLYQVFHNSDGVVDGNSYGIVVNKLGVAVNGFPFQTEDRSQASKNIFIDNVSLNNHKANVREVVALMQNNKAVIDPVGAVFQVRNKDPQGSFITISNSDDNLATYLGNVVANAQALVAKAALNGYFAHSHLDVTRLNITHEVIDWIENQGTLASLLSKPNSGYLCNGDSMFHVDKGVIGIKLDADQNIHLKNSTISNYENLGQAGSKICGDDYGGDNISHPAATLPGYGGSCVRGVSLAGSTIIHINNVKIDGLKSQAGEVIGFDIMTNSDKASVKNTLVSNLEGGPNVLAAALNPTAAPKGVGYKIGSNTKGVKLQNYCGDISTMSAYSSCEEVIDLSGSARMIRKHDCNK